MILLAQDLVEGTVEVLLDDERMSTNLLFASLTERDACEESRRSAGQCNRRKKVLAKAK